MGAGEEDEGLRRRGGGMEGPPALEGDHGVVGAVSDELGEAGEGGGAGGGVVAGGEEGADGPVGGEKERRIKFVRRSKTIGSRT